MRNSVKKNTLNKLFKIKLFTKLNSKVPISIFANTKGSESIRPAIKRLPQILRSSPGERIASLD